jgi:xanthine/uracil/vitamin C permease (AzgA family)
MPPPIMRISDASTQAIAVSGTSAQSAAISASSGYVRLVATTLCHIRVGSSPTATTSNMPLAPYVPEYFVVPSGNKVAVIQNSSSGTLYITEVTT